MELAVYGKGGIGKSTVSANLSAALSLAGEKVLQIGCDPKHDSTRLLMHGKGVPMVLDYLKETVREKENVAAVLETGFHGIGCIEAGGPRPGVGCAGRGIISAFEFLDRHQVKQRYGTVVYDVLGDVVCGGFAVPVRREYADAIFLVTSGEYMALYAANNILRGIHNFDGDRHSRVAGILYNERKLADEDGRVRRFAQAVGLPVCVKIPRSDVFARAEEKNVTVMEMGGCKEEQEIFRKLAGKIRDGLSLYQAKPLTDEELEEVVLGSGSHRTGTSASGSGPCSGGSAASPVQENQISPLPEEGSACGEDSPAASRPPLYGCAFNGAATTAVHLTDALVLAHSPRACAFYTWQNISSPGRKNLFNRGILMPSAISPNFECTDMGQAETVFGGMEQLKSHVRAALRRHPGAVVAISSCVSGIIGDDIREIESYSTPETPVIAICADGDITGDYMEGIRMCTYTLAERLIDPQVKPHGRRVNLINETGVSNNLTLNYRIVRSLLAQMGIEVNCRFLGDATCAQVKNLLAAPLNILADDGEDGQKLKSWLSERYGCQFLDGCFPVGFQASAKFVGKLGEYFHCQEAAQGIIGREEEAYHRQVEALKPSLAGKRILMTTINANMDWLMEAAAAIGMEFVWVGVLNYLHTELHITDHPECCGAIEETFDFSKIHEKIEELCPDIVLSNYTSTVKEGDYLRDSMPMTPVAGFHSALYIFGRWAKLLNVSAEGAWKDDKTLFEKYYS